jgi:glycosyltransferase involved in cell wall biosynthesis
VIEILICDDGSTDDSKTKISALNDPKIKWIDCGRNGSPAVPRNIGIMKSSGTWVAFLDSDDEWMPTKIQEQVEVVKATTCLAVSTNAHKVVNGDLQGEYLNLFSKWMSAKARPAQEASKAYWMSVPDEEFRSIQSVKGKKAWESLSQLERSNELTRRANLLSEEERIEKAKKGWETKKLKGNAYAPPGMSIPVRVTAPSGEVMTFSSMTAAALELNCSRVSVYRHATGKRVVSKLKGYLIELETT